jgi:hypothetical protein
VKSAEAKAELLRERPGAIAVRLNKEREEWEIWAGSWTGAQFLGRGASEAEAWENAMKRTKGRKKTRKVYCRACFAPLEIPEDAEHPNQCDNCRRQKASR